MKQKKVGLYTFGRQKGRRLTSQKQHALETGLAKYGVNLSPNLDPKTVFDSPFNAYVLEIGFGMGERLSEAARRNPNTGFIGAEVFENGIANLCIEVLADELQNIRVFYGNAVELIDSLIPASLDRIDILFPDPWPKKRHHKRRLINIEHLSRFAELLKPQGHIVFATDNEAYAQHVLEITLTNKDFYAQPAILEEACSPPSGWIPTKFEQKPNNHGGRSYYFKLIKTS